MNNTNFATGHDNRIYVGVDYLREHQDIIHKSSARSFAAPLVTLNGKYYELREFKDQVWNGYEVPMPIEDRAEQRKEENEKNIEQAVAHSDVCQAMESRDMPAEVEEDLMKKLDEFVNREKQPSNSIENDIKVLTDKLQKTIQIVVSLTKANNAMHDHMKEHCQTLDGLSTGFSILVDRVNDGPNTETTEARLDHPTFTVRQLNEALEDAHKEHPHPESLLTIYLALKYAYGVEK